MARQRTGLYYAFLILFIIVALIIVILRSWVGGGAWWEYLWKPGEVQPGSRPVRVYGVPFEIQVLLMIIIIIAGIAIAAWVHKRVTAK